MSLTMIEWFGHSGSVENDRARRACLHAERLIDLVPTGHASWHQVWEARLVEADAWEEAGVTEAARIARRQADQAMRADRRTVNKPLFKRARSI